ncbi:MAG TPA: sigma-70 family RNA polymerase sigma factor [Thermoanaerobaculia bacterium]
MTFEEIYTTLLPLLRRIAEQQFRVPEHDSDAIAHEVLLSYLRKREPVREVRSYLIGALSNNCRTYWRSQARMDRDAEMPVRVRVPHYESVIDLRRFLGRLPPLQRRIVVLHAQGWTVKEIAARIGYSPSWTEKLLRRAREAAAEELDLTHRRRVGRGVARTDTSDCRRMICAHVRPVRGPAVPRAPARAAVFPLHRVPAGEVRRELPAARGLVPPSRRAA